MATTAQTLLAAAAPERSGSDVANWWTNGGQETLDSYEVNDPSDIPEEHQAWLRYLPFQIADPERLYVHAGIRPGISLTLQSTQDLL